ncbi:MAG: hypothetical protein ACD_30C00047G0019 [uncultured bacterium]|uniref:DUF4258 domain-containing protein n=4 Tax=Candidatus Daviesiibacteriota TaxID=1752718 RepID=A0A0G0EYZ6_9BACT|nr:MAG: hypothetical protein ACD_30C00047G0019 [uncultured bacterium]KKQ10712.1 MAG: hypothetical protein US19_C0001G0050 [Candidatus Daviesbacteria bacterium GW2011_GWB1_36_5]KKQ15824.1 MAG: hypothetical protein US28_C0009G0003 [Candidatus Daviesbacteria bacterium GW2011_GWA1_36_8]OGE16875.1 MAG: hypothetical protein A2858_03150 [Candidatus Daviesbacteria bacterium RIFCSPHIGHO2_01_FULL_36_37]OGE31231.1 MAG: hypothetical protein A3C99_01125 [Candidatus Daviesbacteria bacterium RIFCSPHIGHO2_02_F
MKVILRPHLKIRLKERKIPQKYPEIIVISPENKYLDTETNHQIVVKKLVYNEKLRPMVVSYDIIDSTIQIITIHPISEQEIQNKLNRKRWIKNEEN